MHEESSIVRSRSSQGIWDEALGFSALRTSSIMFALPLCDGRRHSRSDDQFSALVAKMPGEGPLFQASLNHGG